MSAADEVMRALDQVRLMRAPLDGFKLHAGPDALDRLKREFRPASLHTGEIGNFWGVPVVPEESPPDLLELRWTIRV